MITPLDVDALLVELEEAARTGSSGAPLDYRRAYCMNGVVQATADTTLTIRIGTDLKKQADDAAKADDRTLTDYVTRAIKERLAARCAHCGRADRPDGGAGLSAAFDDFLAVMRAQRNAGSVTITAVVAERHTAYCGTLVHNEESQGLLLMTVSLWQGSQWLPVALPVPRGVISGWQDDPGQRHFSHLVGLGYANGNDSALRAHILREHPRVASLRVVCEHLCAHPAGLSLDEFARLVGSHSVSTTLKGLLNAGLVTEVGPSRVRATCAAEEMLVEAPRRGLNLDQIYY